MANLKLQVQLSNGRLVPVSQYDAERMEDYAQGALFNLTATKQRSNPSITFIGLFFAKSQSLRASGRQNIICMTN